RKHAIRGDRGELKQWRSLRQRKGGNDVVRSERIHVAARTHVLIHKYGQVLGDSMSEVRAEHTQVKAPTIPHTDHCLRGYLIGKTKPRRKERPVIVNIAAQVVFTVACHADNA